MGLNVVEVLVTAKNETGKAFAEADGEASAFTDTVSKVGFIGAAAMAGIGVASVVMAAKFNEAMLRIVTQANAPMRSLAMLKTGVLNLAGQVGFSPDSLAEALFHVESSFGSTGITGKKALDILKVAAEGANIGGANLVDVQNALDAAIVSGIPGVQNYRQAMGALNAIVGVGDMTMQNLAEALGTGVLASVKGFGLSLKDVGAALAVFGDNNIRGAKAGTQLRMAVQALAAPIKAGIPLLAHLGIGANQLATDMQKGGLKKAISDLVTHMDKMGITAKQQGQILTEAFGKKAGVGIQILTGQYQRFLSKYPDLEKGAHSFAGAVKAEQATLAQQFRDLMSWGESLLVTIGEKLTPVVSALTGFLLRNKGAIKDIMEFTALLVAGLAAYAIGAKVAAAVTWLMTDAAGALDEALMTNPIGVIVTVLAAVVAGLIMAYNHFSWFRTIVDDTAHVVVGFAKNVVHWIGDVVDFIKSHWQMLLAILIGPIVLAVDLIKDQWHHITDAVADVVNWIRDHWKLLIAIILGPLGLIIDALVTHWSAVKHGFEDAWKFVVRIVGDAAGFIEHIVGDLMNWVGDIWRTEWDALKPVVMAVWDFIKSMLRMDIDEIKAILGWFSRLAELFRGWWDDAVRAVSGEIGKLIGFVESIPGRINRALGGLPAMMFRAGVHVIESLLSGVTSMVGHIGSVIGGIASKVAGFFGLSPAKEGPLSSSGAPEIRGAHFAADLARGMLSGRGAIASAAGQLARTAGLGGAGGYGGGYGSGGGRLELDFRAQSSDPLMRAFFQAIRLEVRKVGGGGPDSVQRTFGRVTA